MVDFLWWWQDVDLSMDAPVAEEAERGVRIRKTYTTAEALQKADFRVREGGVGGGGYGEKEKGGQVGQQRMVVGGWGEV